MSDEETINTNNESKRGVIATYLDGFSGLIGIIIFANVLGVSNLGKYYVILAISQIIASPTDGVSIYIEHIVGRVRKEKIGGVISTGVIINTLIPVILSGFLILGYIYIPTINTYLTDIQLILLVSMTISYSLKFTFLSIYSGLGNPSNSIFISSGEGFIQTIIQIGLLIEFGISGLLLGTVIANSIVILYIITKPSVSIQKPEIDFKYALDYTKWSVITYTTKSIYDRLGVVLLVLLTTDAAVGIYEATMKIIQSSRFVSDGIGRSLMVKFSQNKNNYPTETVNKLGGYSSIISIPMLFGGLIIGRDLLTVLYNDPQFAMGYYILVGGAFYFTIKSHSTIINSVLNGSGNPKISAISMVASFIVLLCSGILLIHSLGFNGIILALILSEICRILILLYGYNAISKQIYKPNMIQYQFISGILMMIFVYLVHSIGLNPIIIQLTISLIIGFITYSMILIILDKNIRSHIFS